jgi:hypothetical protein
MSIPQDLSDIATVDSTVRSGTGAYTPEETKSETPAAQTEEVKSETPAEVPVVAATETPKEAVAETPKTETAPEPQIDIQKILAEASGGKITSAEQLSKILEENTSLSEKVNSAPQVSEYAMKMEAWLKKGYEPELFHLVHDLPIDEMSADDTVKSYLKIQNPDWSEEDINLYVKHTYNQMSEEDEGYNSNTVRVGSLKLKQDSVKMASELRKLQDATIYSNADEKEAERMEGERQTTWKTNLSTLSVSKIPFQIDEKNSFDFVPNQAQIQNAMKTVEKAILNAPVNYDENGINAVKELIKNTIITQNINDIIRAASKQVSSIVTEQKIKETHNPSTPESKPASVIEKSSDEKNFDKMDALFFG